MLACIMSRRQKNGTVSFYKLTYRLSTHTAKNLSLTVRRQASRPCPVRMSGSIPDRDHEICHAITRAGADGGQNGAAHRPNRNGRPCRPPVPNMIADRLSAPGIGAPAGQSIAPRTSVTPLRLSSAMARR